MYRNKGQNESTKKKPNENNAGGYNLTKYDFILFRMVKESERNETEKKKKRNCGANQIDVMWC